MKSSYKKLGKYIRQIDIRNKDLSINRLLGVSITKQFIESIANTVGTDFSNYKIVKQGQFAYGPVTSRNGEKVSIALLKEKECIISSSYSVFEIIDKNQLMPEYLMLWFSRPEFDRYARFKSHGSVREIFDWDEMCNVELPVPPIEEQKKIVNNYQIITKRIELKKKINDNLEMFALTSFNMLYKNTRDIVNGKIDDFGEFIRGKNITSAEMKNGNIPVISAGIELSGFHNVYNAKAPVITISGSGVNAGYVSFHFKNIWASDCSYNNSSEYICSLYLLLKKYQSKITELQKGTAQPHVYPKEVNPFEIQYPSKKVLQKFENSIRHLFNSISDNNNEILKLERLKGMLLAKLDC